MCVQMCTYTNMPRILYPKVGMIRFGLGLGLHLAWFGEV